MAMFDEAKAGTKLWSFHDGWGTVIVNQGHVHGKALDMQFNGAREQFTLEGKYFAGELNPTLFWDEVKIIPPEKPKEECEACRGLEAMFNNDQAFGIDDMTPILVDFMMFLLNQHHTCEKGKK